MIGNLAVLQDKVQYAIISTCASSATATLTVMALLDRDKEALSHVKCFDIGHATIFSAGCPVGIIVDIKEGRKDLGLGIECVVNVICCGNMLCGYVNIGVLLQNGL